jgi:hypothetical protein
MRATLALLLLALLLVGWAKEEVGEKEERLEDFAAMDEAPQRHLRGRAVIECLNIYGFGCCSNGVSCVNNICSNCPSLGAGNVLSVPTPNGGSVNVVGGVNTVGSNPRVIVVGTNGKIKPHPPK